MWTDLGGDTMKHVCSWCEKEGRPAWLGHVAGPAGQVTHGICAVHRADLYGELIRQYGEVAVKSVRGRLQPLAEILAQGRAEFPV